jgi:hypothetical protein
MIFDLQLFDSPASGIALGKNTTGVIEIGSTGGVGTDAWKADTSYTVGFGFDKSGNKSSLAITDTSMIAGDSISFIDLDGDGKYNSATEAKITWTNASMTSGQLTPAGGDAIDFVVGGSYISAAGTQHDSWSAGAVSYNGEILTASGWSSTATSSGAVAVSDVTGAGYSAVFGDTNASVRVVWTDFITNNSLDAGEIVTSISGIAGAGNYSIFGITATSAYSSTGVSVFTGDLAVSLADAQTGVTFTDITGTAESYAPTALFDTTSLSFLSATGASLTAVSTKLENAVTSASISDGKIYNVDWNTQYSAFMSVSSSVAWDTKDIRKIKNVTVTADALYGDTSAYTLNINNGYVENVNLGGYQMNLMLTSVANSKVNVTGIDTDAAVNRTISFNSAKNINANMSLSDSSAGALYITNNDYTTHLLGGSVLNNTTVTGKQTGKITFNAKDNDVLNFGEGTDSAFVNVSTIGKYGGILKMRSEETTGTNVITVDSLTGGYGTVNITGLKGKSNFIINGNNGTVVIDDSDGQASTADTLAGVSIIGAENTWTTEQYTGKYLPTNGALKADLSGKGLEYVSVANHGVVVVADDWVFNNHSVVGAKGDNVLSIGQHSILDVEGGIYKDSIDINRDGKVDFEWDTTAAVVGTHLFGSGDADKTSEKGLPSGIAVTSAADSSAKNNRADIGKYEVMKIESQGNTYNAFITSGASLSSSDTGINWNRYDIIVGDKLDLTGITDKKSVYLNNGLGKGDWDDTNSYSANMTSVISSSVGGSRIIGDYENSVYFYGSGHLDSLFGGYAYDHTSSRHIVNGGTEVDGVTVSVDTLASASGKKAWMGSSDYSGQTKVELLHNGMNTYNFGFVGEDYSVTGSSVKGTETDDTADVLTLMNGMGTHSLQGSEHSRANLIVGANASNNFTFQSISEGVHDILYTFELGRDPQKARVDTSLSGSTANFNYQDDVAFYLGFNNGTVLTMNADDSGKKVNYGGGNVIVDISTIDGSAAAGGNILNGQENHAEYIVASKKVGDTLCGGITSGNTDTANDTLVGGAGADVFWVGAEMGNDVINNLTDGDTIVFLGSKFADATLNYENERMVDYADSHWMTVSFDNGDSKTKISVTPGDGIATHMSDLKDVTAVFDDGTYTWDGSKWTQA